MFGVDWIRNVDMAENLKLLTISVIGHMDI